MYVIMTVLTIKGEKLVVSITIYISGCINTCVTCVSLQFQINSDWWNIKINTFTYTSWNKHDRSRIEEKR